MKFFIESKSDCKLISQNYIKSKEKLAIQCGCGTQYYVTFDKFKSKNQRQCGECSNSTVTKTGESIHTLSYVKKFINENSNCKYVEEGGYLNGRSKINILCDCGNMFQTNFSKFKHRNKRQCGECGDVKRAHIQRKSQCDFDVEVQTICGNEYIFLEKYKNYISPIKVKHIACGHEYSVSPSNFIKGRRCAMCSGKHTPYNYSEILEYVVKESECTLISNKYRGIDNLLLFKCNCENKFKTSFYNFKFRNKKQCKSYSNKRSASERKVLKILDECQITECESEYTMKGCGSGKNKSNLRFDFSIGSLLIECDGSQHFKSVEYWGGEAYLNKLQKNDNIKNTYCIEIPYWEFDKIKNILEHVLGYYDLIEKSDVDRELVHKFLVNHPNWSHEKYIIAAV